MNATMKAIRKRLGLPPEAKDDEKVVDALQVLSDALPEGAFADKGDEGEPKPVELSESAKAQMAALEEARKASDARVEALEQKMAEELSLDIDYEKIKKDREKQQQLMQQQAKAQAQQAMAGTPPGAGSSVGPQGPQQPGQPSGGAAGPQASQSGGGQPQSSAGSGASRTGPGNPYG